MPLRFAPPLRRRAVLILLGAALAIAASCGGGRDGGSAGVRLRPGVDLPELEVRDIDGRPASLRVLTNGKVALVDIWTSWCGPCHMLAPYLQKWHSRYAPQGFTVVGVMADDDALQIGPGYIRERRFLYPVLMDEGARASMARWGLGFSFPTLVLVGRDGKVLQVFIGFGPERIEKALERALATS